MQNDCLQLLFAHHDEAIPDRFLDYAKPTTANPNERQIRKWKSRRTAYFLLHQLFEKNNLDASLLSHIQKTESGRPYILDEQIDFNISHSGEWVAVLLSRSDKKRCVGIDIEQPQKIRPYEKLLSYYADDQEKAEILQCKHLPQLASIEQRFYLSWCLREAVLKSQGIGIIKLSEVTHRLSEQTITSAHCPQGKLSFHADLPFHLAYFVEQEKSVLLSTDIAEWKNGQFYPHNSKPPIIYQVN